MTPFLLDAKQSAELLGVSPPVAARAERTSRWEVGRLDEVAIGAQRSRRANVDALHVLQMQTTRTTGASPEREPCPIGDRTEPIDA